MINFNEVLGKIVFDVVMLVLLGGLLLKFGSKGCDIFVGV